MKRTIKDLTAMDGRVYVYCANEEIGLKFLKLAEDEGFTFGDGVKPTGRECANIMAVNHDCTLNYVGANGAIAFQAADKIGEENLIKIDMEKYLSDDEDFYLNNKM